MHTLLYIRVVMVVFYSYIVWYGTLYIAKHHIIYKPCWYQKIKALKHQAQRKSLPLQKVILFFYRDNQAKIYYV